MAKCYLCQKDTIPFMGGFTMNGIPGKICDTCREEYLKIASSNSDGTYFSDILTSVPNHPSRAMLNKIIQDATISYATSSNGISHDDVVEEIHSMPIATTDFLANHTITEYKNVVTGISVLGTGIFSELDAGDSDFFGKNSSIMESKISTSKDSSLFHMKREAFALSCNAVVGVSLNFIPFTNNMIGIVASGTAVVTSKNTD